MYWSTAQHIAYPRGPMHRFPPPAPTALLACIGLHQATWKLLKGGEQWFKGEIMKYRPKDQAYFITYEDGEEEWGHFNASLDAFNAQFDEEEEPTKRAVKWLSPKPGVKPGEALAAAPSLPCGIALRARKQPGSLAGSSGSLAGSSGNLAGDVERGARLPAAGKQGGGGGGGVALTRSNRSSEDGGGSEGGEGEGAAAQPLQPGAAAGAARRGRGRPPGPGGRKAGRQGPGQQQAAGGIGKAAAAAPAEAAAAAVPATPAAVGKSRGPGRPPGSSGRGGGRQAGGRAGRAGPGREAAAPQAPSGAAGALADSCSVEPATAGGTMPAGTDDGRPYLQRSGISSPEPSVIQGMVASSPGPSGRLPQLNAVPLTLTTHGQQEPPGWKDGEATPLVLSPPPLCSYSRCPANSYSRPSRWWRRRRTRSSCSGRSGCGTSGCSR